MLKGGLVELVIFKHGTAIIFPLENTIEAKYRTAIYFYEDYP